uniref:GIY-YIG domain-containing protein n=1 Tax=Amphimedon queenslandica TaxID=400682 RepID=A0A1X7UGQ5_AMPQE
MDVINLYPSIPQKECIEIVHNEMVTHSELVTSNPNLITQLLQLNMTNNFFEFADITFLQRKGTAMGAAFSPTVANIFMSTLLRKFLSSTSDRPLFMRRYIDDIFMVWPRNKDLDKFLSELNNFHPQIKFTTTQSDTAVNFLDITIYKNSNFTATGKLSTSTYEKENNLFQYLHFESNHSISIYKGIIIGEAMRYVRTNSTEEKYKEQLSKFIQRLKERKYPESFIYKTLRNVSYKRRTLYLRKVTKAKPQIMNRPKMKCIPPPRYLQLKKIIINEFHRYNLSRYCNQPLFITLKNTTLKDLLVNSKHKPTEEDGRTIVAKTKEIKNHQSHNLNVIRKAEVKQPSKCNHNRCATCQHFNPNINFNSTSTRQTYRIRHSFTCSSSNIIYLITCEKCRKQYVGQTTKTLRERIYHHRSSIKTGQRRYISKHFNLEGHKIQHLKVQVIDTNENTETLNKLERYWIQKLDTMQPRGLNVTTD